MDLVLSFDIYFPRCKIIREAIYYADIKNVYLVAAHQFLIDLIFYKCGNPSPIAAGS
jgi:hypothetical protein